MGFEGFLTTLGGICAIGRENAGKGKAIRKPGICNASSEHVIGGCPVR
jgi:hypothetical protein